VDAEFVNELFDTKEALFGVPDSPGKPGLTSQVKTTDYGEVLGSKDFFKSAVQRFERRKKPTHQSKGVQRIDERYLEPLEKVLMEFEQINGVKMLGIDTKGFKGKRLRGELLVNLKDRVGLKY
jgi:hypothetical protein